ncbi:MAG TPA: hypothetical protein VKP30_33260 [Polyangiaceae bacterium]|nr:hypothetical protein [Polyangiaceae bacterium]
MLELLDEEPWKWLRNLDWSALSSGGTGRTPVLPNGVAYLVVSSRILIHASSASITCGVANAEAVRFFTRIAQVQAQA